MTFDSNAQATADVDGGAVTTAHPEQTDDSGARTSNARLALDELLVEEVSIDGMCGVY